MSVRGRSAAFAGLSGVFDRWQRKEGEKMETGKRTKNEWRGGEMIEKIRKR